MAEIQIDYHHGVVTPNPGGQADFMNDWVHEVVGLEGGWMSGKTWGGGRKLLKLHIHNSYNSDGEPTGVPSAALSPTYGNAMDFQVPELQDACHEIGLPYHFHSSGTLRGRFQGPFFHFPDLGWSRRPSVILIRSADAPERITGWQVGAGWGDEPARWKENRFNPLGDAYLQFSGRVRHPHANFVQRMFTYTNEGDGTRIYEELHSGEKTSALYRAPTKENPLAIDFFNRQIKLLTKELAEQYLGGKAAALRGGRVYPSFNTNKHTTSKVKLSKKRPLHLSLDFNISPGMHGEVGQYIEEEDMFIVAYELYAPRMSVRGLMQRFIDLIEKLGGWQWEELQIFGDASGTAESITTGESCYYVLEQALQEHNIPYRIRVPRSNPPIVDRINAVEVAFIDHQDKVHYQIHPRCERLIEDYRVLKRNEFGEISTVDKKLSHASSAEGYRISYLRPARVTLHLTGQHSVRVPS